MGVRLISYLKELALTARRLSDVTEIEGYCLLGHHVVSWKFIELSDKMPLEFSRYNVHGLFKCRYMLYWVDGKWMKMTLQQWWNNNRQGKTKVLEDKLAPLPLCPPQIPYGLPYQGTWVSPVRSREHTAWITPWTLRSWFWVALDPRHITWRVALTGRPAAQLPGSVRLHWSIVNMGLLTRGFNTRKSFSELYSQLWHAPCPRK
jgi:hypothetical protein